MPVPSPEFAADLAACRNAIRGGSRSFFTASLLLPRSVRDPAYALYAFCREADDAIDHAEEVGPALREMRERLDRIYAGRYLQGATERAFSAVVAHYAIPRQLPEALLEGFAWDARGKRYETLSQLHDYAARVAGSVGVMMALLMGVRSRQALARACDLGIAMQLTNIARDVGEDARHARLYLPREWMREAGMDPEAWLANPVFGAPLKAVVARLLAAADESYVNGEAGIARLPFACRPGILASRVLYAEIGREVERRGCDSVTQRAVVSASRQAALALRAAGAAPFLSAGDTAPPASAARYLVEAAAHEGAGERVRSGALNSLLDLYERLERRERSRAAA